MFITGIGMMDCAKPRVGTMAGKRHGRLCHLLVSWPETSHFPSEVPDKKSQ